MHQLRLPFNKGLYGKLVSRNLFLSCCMPCYPIFCIFFRELLVLLCCILHISWYFLFLHRNKLRNPTYELKLPSDIFMFFPFAIFWYLDKLCVPHFCMSSYRLDGRALKTGRSHVTHFSNSYLIMIATRFFFCKLLSVEW